MLLISIDNFMYICYLQESGERERKSRLFARDRNSSSAGKSKKQEKQEKPGILSPVQVQADYTIAEVSMLFKQFICSELTLKKQLQILSRIVHTFVVYVFYK